METYIKNFDAWNEVKKNISSRTRDIAIRAGDVRWAILGVNVGSEIDGKGPEFLRPVLVINLKGNTKALAVPLTSTRYTLPGYMPFNFGDKSGSLCIHDLRVISQNRLGRRYGHIHRRRLRKVKEHIKSFFEL